MKPSRARILQAARARWSVSLILIAVLVHAAVAQDNALTLQQVLERADQQNPELVAARARRAIALAGVQIAKQRPNPTVSFSVSRDAPHESALMEQPLELGLKRSERIQLAEQEGKVIDVGIATLSRQIRRRAREGFYKVLATRAQAEQLASALELARRLKDIAQSRFELGDVAQLEVLQAQLELSRAETEYKLAAQQANIAVTGLNVLLNQSSAAPLTLQGTISELPKTPELKELTAKTAESNSELQRLTQERNIELRRKSLLQWERVPNLGVQFGTDLNSPPDFDVGPRGQLSMTLPLFNRNQGEIAQASATAAALDLTISATRRSAEAQVQSAALDVAARREQAETYRRDLLPAVEKIEGMAEDSYKSGKSNILVVIDAQRRITDIRRAYFDNLFALQSAFAALEELVGAPLD